MAAAVLSNEPNQPNKPTNHLCVQTLEKHLFNQPDLVGLLLLRLLPNQINQ